MRDRIADVRIPLLDDVVDSAYVRSLIVGTVGFLALLGLLGLLFPETVVGDLAGIVFSGGTAASTVRLSAPIVLAALGGIFAEKSGVINIGLEGLLIISAFTSIYVAFVVGDVGLAAGSTAILIGFLAGVLASTLLAFVFGVVCIEFKADQIIAGLAIWLIALGLAPFLSTVLFGSVNTPGVGNVSWHYSGVLVAVGTLVSWWTLNHTAFGNHIEAAGENPRALDTVGVSVSRVRHAGVLLSGVFAGAGGGALALTVGRFIGSGETMVQGKGFIAIVAYLFGNYNPLGALGAGALFAGLEAIQLRLQQLGYGIPSSLVETIPYVVVIVVLALVGRTRLPAAAGDHYETEE
ncbi:ABC transporter permease [Halorubrum sp. DTA98]|uniref:ABC transporter permease n=1 Tax=Halorubrum sp. DTA98 TaxID=3402163 RepID=UPI003AAC55E1